MKQLLHTLLHSAGLASPPAAASPPTPGTPRSLQRLTASLLLAAGMIFGATSAEASHFRGASLTWKKLASPANTVEVTVTESWAVSPGNTYSWGDNTGSFSTTIAAGAVQIASGSDATGSFLVTRRVVTHTYPHAGPWTISSTSGNRIGNLINASNGGWTLNSVVDMRNGNQGSPVISSPTVLQMVRGGVNTVPLSFADVDGDNVTFRMATSAESGIASVASAGGKTLSVSSSGVLTWDTSSALVNQLYAVQVIANDNHPGTPVGTSRVFFDLMIQIVDGTLNKPPVASGNSGPFVAAIGVPFTNTITGTDADGGNLTVTHLGLPSGATLTPVSGTTGPQPLAATFSWTPTPAAADSSVGVTIVFTDPGGLQATKSFSISVPSNQPPTANAGPDVTVLDTNANYQPTLVMLDGSASSDPENIPLTYSWTQIGTPAVTLSGATTATPTFLAPTLQNQNPVALTFQLSVSDGKSTRTDDVIVTVAHNNRAPTATASGPAMAPEGTTVTLDGSQSFDPDYDTLTYTWTQTFGPPVGLSSNGTNNPMTSFTLGVGAPHSVAGELLKFTLTVTDGITSSTTTELPVFIQNVNQAPIVSAGDDAVVFDTVGEVEIHSHAQDPDGDMLTYQWVQVAGPTVTIEHDDEDHAHVVIPAVTPEQGSITLTFQLVVSDAIDDNDAAALFATSNPVNITVHHANRAPVADAGANRSAPELSIVTLDGSGSFDPDGDQIRSYTWTQVGGTRVELDTTDAAHPSFTAPDVGFAGETLTFELVVADVPAAGSGSSLTSAPSTVTVNVTYVNRAPIAFANGPSSVDEGSVVELAGGGVDPDGNNFTFSWTQIAGPSVVLSSDTVANPTFTAPQVGPAGATLAFQLIVTDEFNLASQAALAKMMVINVNKPPVADAGLTVSVPEGSAVTLAGLASDPDANDVPTLRFAWTQTSGPAVTLTGAETLTPSFTAPIVTAGGDPLARETLKFNLTVTDSSDEFATDEVEVVVANVDHAPIANANGAMIIGEATAVTLNGSFSSDPDGDALTYAWVQTEGPSVALSDANTATPSFTTPFVSAAGATLKFKLSVQDPFGGQSSDVATVSVVNTNDPPAATAATASLGTLWPPDHRMVPISIAGVVDPNNNATITITGVTQDEPTNGLGDGDTAIDAIINPDGTVLLRSERSGKGDGRVYRVSFTASDLEGSVSGVVKVGVPHSKKSDPLKDSGGVFDSTH